MIQAVLLVVGFLFSVAMMLWDGYETGKGTALGVALEGNGLVVRLFGNKPTFSQFVTLELPVRIGIAALGFIPTPQYPRAAMFVVAVCLVVYGVKSLVQGVIPWRKLIQATVKK